MPGVGEDSFRKHFDRRWIGYLGDIVVADAVPLLCHPYDLPNRAGRAELTKALPNLNQRHESPGNLRFADQWQAANDRRIKSS